MRPPGPPILLVNPASDSAFLAAVEAAMARTPVPGPSALEALLRAEFPLVVVRVRDLEGEHKRMWYVYREGFWVPPGTPRGGR